MKDHVTKARELLEMHETSPTIETRKVVLAQAQVHATLALADRLKDILYAINRLQ